MNKRQKKKPRIEWFVDRENHRLIEWSDGTVEWIPDDFARVSYNHRTVFSRLGWNYFRTRRSCDRTIYSFPDTVTISALVGKRVKNWTSSPVCGAPAPSKVPQLPSFRVGEVVRLKSPAQVYSIGDAETWMSTRPIAACGAGDHGIVLETGHEGKIVQVVIGVIRGWIETRFLSRLEAPVDLTEEEAL